MKCNHKYLLGDMCQNCFERHPEIIEGIKPNPHKEPINQIIISRYGKSGVTMSIMLGAFEQKFTITGEMLDCATQGVPLSLKKLYDKL